ncbi:single-stranded-DNA-specific exonuclease RecJ [Caldanaerobacter subterraneus]|uniref:Single-stranded-DNA-specific exonuclease RecJ n=1 Tax=Caldanaerobacter subterraneus TaxID=911092 RepID=A0A7Y2L609_9THEO|nr:DHH family phosphoesterase [Caldanaerobacter subterraneus]NNG66409.1 hypothetical protein [Caldanaerobacter subterraneus]
MLWKYNSNTSLELDRKYSIEKNSFTLNHIAKTIISTDRIAIFGDYDVDGICASIILKKALDKVGIKNTVRLPERKEGYGIKPCHIRELKEKGFNTIITVDNGITAFEAAIEARKLGVKLIITDHHEPKETLPDADIILNPKIFDDGFQDYSGAGLSYLVAKRVLKLADLPEIEDFIQLASLATVADLVPLKNNNWYIARKGLDSMRKSPIKGILRILENSGVSYRNIGGFELSWIISPRINAAGRLESPLLSYKLLLYGEGVDEIDKLNKQRMEIVNRCIEKIKDSGNKFLIYVLQNCPEGILGLIAGKVAEKFKKPVIVTVKEGAYIRGSARSVGKFNLLEAFDFISKKVDISFGGHKSACGVSFDIKDLNLVQQLLNEYIEQNPVEEEINELDGILVRKPSLEEVQNLDSFEPFGFKNPEPAFLLEGKVIDIKRGNGWTLIKLDNDISFFGSLNYYLGQKAKLVVRPIIKNGRVSMRVLDETPEVV